MFVTPPKSGSYLSSSSDSSILSLEGFFSQLQLKYIFYPATHLPWAREKNLLKKLHSAKFCWITKLRFCYFN